MLNIDSQKSVKRFQEVVFTHKERFMLFKLFKLTTKQDKPLYFIHANDAYAAGYRHAALKEVYAFYNKAEQTTTELGLFYKSDKYHGSGEMKTRGLSALANGFYNGYVSWLTVGDTEYYGGVTTRTLGLTQTYPNTGSDPVLINIYDDTIEAYNIAGQISLTPDQLKQAEIMAAELINKERAQQKLAQDKARLFRFNKTNKHKFKNLYTLTEDEEIKLRAAIDLQYEAVHASRSANKNKHDLSADLCSLYNLADNLKINEEPSAVATRNNEDKFSIAADALLLLNGLQQAAELMANENVSVPTYETTDENDANDEKDQKLHHVEFTLHASGLSEKRFYAASEWLYGAIIRLRRVKKDDLDDWQNILEFHLTRESKLVQLIVHHHRPHFDCNTVLPAPVAAFPYEEVKLTMDDMLTASFTGWQESSGQAVAQKYFSDSEDMYKNFYDLSHIQCACQKIDEDFKIGFGVFESSGKNRHGIYVTITNLEKAREMMGYKRSLLLLSNPAISRMLAASSPVMHRTRQNKDTSQPETGNNNNRTMI